VNHVIDAGTVQDATEVVLAKVKLPQAKLRRLHRVGRGEQGRDRRDQAARQG
jgi:hypothetical protein